MQKGTKSSSLSMDKQTNFMSQSSDMFELSNSLDIHNDFLDTKKRGRQQRGADGKFESLLKDSDFNGPTFSITNSSKQQNQ